MKVIIAGGSGFLGKALIESLTADGHTVTILSRNPARLPTRASVKAAAWDARTPGEWVGLLDGCDWVVNFTGENIGAGRWTRKRKQKIRASRALAGQALVEALRRVGRKPGGFLQASAIGYYGTSLVHTFRESDPPGTDWLGGVAEEWENSTAEVEELGIRRVIIRTGLVLDGKGSIMEQVSLPFRLWAGGPLGSGKQWWSWIHLYDEIGAIRFLMDQPDARGAYNLTAPDPRQNADFARALGRAMRRPAWFPAPAFAIRLALGEMSTLVVDGQRVLPDRLQAKGFTFQFPRLEGALADLFPR